MQCVFFEFFRNTRPALITATILCLCALAFLLFCIFAVQSIPTWNIEEACAIYGYIQTCAEHAKCIISPIIYTSNCPQGVIASGDNYTYTGSFRVYFSRYAKSNFSQCRTLSNCGDATFRNVNYTFYNEMHGFLGWFAIGASLIFFLVWIATLVRVLYFYGMEWRARRAAFNAPSATASTQRDHPNQP